MLYQPSNISPDILGPSGNGVMWRGTVGETTDYGRISWEVNGSSPLAAFKIDFYLNTSGASTVYTTGKLTTGCPHYGTDASGNKVPFSYTVNYNFQYDTEYKFVITQWWGSTDAESVTQSSPSVFMVRKTNRVAISTSSPITAMRADIAGARRSNWSPAGYMAPLKRIRWRIAYDTDEGRESPLLDTGSIYGTQLLSVHYDGFVAGTVYAVRLDAEDEDGQELTSGWQSFEVDYDMGELPYATATAAMDAEHYAAAVEWTGAEIIPGTLEGTGTDQLVTSGRGYLKLGTGRNCYWKKADGVEITLESPFTILYGGWFSGGGPGEIFKMDFHREEGVIYIDNPFTCEFSGGVVSISKLPASYGEITLPSFAMTRCYLIIAITHDTMYVTAYDVPDPTATAPSAATAHTFSTPLSHDIRNYVMEKLQISGQQTCDYIRAAKGTPSQALLDTILSNWPPADVDIPGTILSADFRKGINTDDSYIGDLPVTGWAVYRQEGGGELVPVTGGVGVEQRRILDYTVVTGMNPVHYHVFPASNNVYATEAVTSNEVCSCVWDHCIIEAAERDDGTFRAVREYRFSANVETGAVSNNSSPFVASNFGRYPSVIVPCQNYRSGTIKAMLGSVRATDGAPKYTDTLAQRDALEELSTNTNRLFYKTRKGDLIEIRVTGVSVTTSDATRQQAMSVSVSWVQVGDAKWVSIVNY